jgi:hypothetical protein
MDMFAVPPEETAAALRRRGFDVELVHERTHGGRPVVVIGAPDFFEPDRYRPPPWRERRRD